MITPDRRILPAAQAVLVDPTGRATPPFYDFLRRIIAVTGLTPELIQQLEEIIAKLDDLEAGGFMPITSNVIGADSILTQGILANGVVTVQLQGDTSDQKATWYYGSNEDSEKGWFRFYTALGGDFGILKHNSGYTELGEVPDPSDLPPTGNIGEAYWVDGAADITERGLWAWDGLAWVLDPAATGIVSFELDQSIDPTWTGTHIFTQPTLFADGSAGVPSISFIADTNTGLYRVGADQIGITAGGAVRWDINTARVSQNVPLYLPDGSAAVPAYSFGSDTNTGIYRVGADELGCSTAGVERLRIGSSGITSAVNLTITSASVGVDYNIQLSSATPGILMRETDATSGNQLWDFVVAAEQLRMRVRSDDGSTAVNWLTVDRSGTTVDNISLTATAVLGPDGSESQPGWSFVLDTDTGMYRSGGNNLSFSTAGVERIRIGSGVWMQNGSAAVPGLAFLTDTQTGLYLSATNAMGIAANGVAVGRFDADSTAGNTRFMVYDVDNGTLERVSVGAPDSGGTGFKVLRIPN